MLKLYFTELLTNKVLMLLFLIGATAMLAGIVMLIVKSRRKLHRIFAALGIALIVLSTGYHVGLYIVYLEKCSFTIAEAPVPFANVQDEALSHINLRDYTEILPTLTFSTDTVWPWSFQLPRDFKPREVMETGKNPGLGLRQLHAQGITGSGIKVAVVDQTPPLDHGEYLGSIRHFELLTDSEPGLANPSVHGAGVVSLLAGKDIGSAPDVEIYYFADPQWVDEPNFRVQGILRVLEYNQTLPEGEKIRIIAMSKQLHPQEFPEAAAAVQLAREQGIIVLHCGINMGGVQCPQGMDPDNPQSYTLCYDEAIGLNYVQPGALFVPIDNRTVAGPIHDSQYVYYARGGFSWGLPWLAGVVALGLQVNPDLTEDEVFQALADTAFPFTVGGIIQPTAFVESVRK